MTIEARWTYIMQTRSKFLKVLVVFFKILISHISVISVVMISTSPNNKSPKLNTTNNSF